MKFFTAPDISWSGLYDNGVLVAQGDALNEQSCIQLAHAEGQQLEIFKISAAIYDKHFDGIGFPALATSIEPLAELKATV